ncbi:DNA-binding response regulator [Izhakiella australiensis]|uniref:DNA-binding response regulator n=1 Tax=Izhakiella australiensis TaxID=1926881 RepID=A0A1S8YSK9_9GAMM|nr:response regulator [Izhakiella australiensis]OON42161.1 DNA-binding response regulator [Izhakiella australiensis]
MNNKNLILIVEDETEIADIISSYFIKSGFNTLHASNGILALDYHEKNIPSLVILDIRMPGMDGWVVLTEIRKRGDTPVIVLTANDEDSDKVAALRVGADDYVVKPFNLPELVARAEAILRRTKKTVIANEVPVIRNELIDIYPDEHRVVINSKGLDVGRELTTTEFKLLLCFMRQPRKVFSRHELMDLCLVESDALERTVDSHISKLRKKLENAGLSGVPESVRGFGYRLGV